MVRQRKTWLVSVDLPIEADTPGEAARIFWEHVSELGPKQLPVFVAPTRDELAMQVYLGDQPHEYDPEGDD